MGSPSLWELRALPEGDPSLPAFKGPLLRGTQYPWVPKPVYNLDQKLMESWAPRRAQASGSASESLFIYSFVLAGGEERRPQAPDRTHSAHPLSLSLPGSPLGGESSRPAKGLIP